MATTHERRLTADWRRVPEAGTRIGIRFLTLLAMLGGRALVGAFLWIVAGYYALLSRRARHASRSYLARVGHRSRFRDVVRHIHTFAVVAIDRLFFLRGRTAPFEVVSHGEHHLAALHERRAGAILLGSHLGSFEAMRAMGKRDRLRLSIVVDRASAQRVARMLRELAPEAELGVIAMDEDAISTALQIKSAIGRGELVGILADRRAPEAARNVCVEFLGAPAAFPVGPYLVAHTLKCPVYQVFGLFTAPNRYDVYCEPFADAVHLPRGSRDAALCRYAELYAGRLAEYARRAPNNWFNFYDFWTE
jgi:predicted LPLAT superfamily acyltransferase